MSAVISNSEVGTYLACELKHFFAFGLNVAPKKNSKALSRGIIGHKALAIYYQALKEGSDKVLARKLALSFIMEIINENDKEFLYDEFMLNELYQLVRDYLEFYESDPFKVILVEEELVWEYQPSVGYGMRLDLLAQWTGGPNAGKYALIDHKFVYRFKTQDMLYINSQLPKYKAVLEQKGYRVDQTILNQVCYRTRKTSPLSPEEKYSREFLVFKAPEIRQVMKEQIIVADQILQKRSLPLADWKNSTVRAMNEYACTNCQFLAPCRMDLVGQPIGAMLKTEYQDNSYRYEEIEAAE